MTYERGTEKPFALQPWTTWDDQRGAVASTRQMKGQRCQMQGKREEGQRRSNNNDLFEHKATSETQSKSYYKSSTGAKHNLFTQCIY